MISASSATIIILVFIGIFGLVLPVLERIEKVRECISYRWAVMVLLMAVMLGCVLDFSHLDDQTRIYTIVGVTIVCCIYIIIRSVEKALANGWSLGVKHIRVEKGDLKADVETVKHEGGKDDGE